MTPQQERTLTRLHKGIVICAGISVFNLFLVAGINLYHAIEREPETRYITLPSQDGPEHYPEMSRGPANPPRDVEAVAGEDSPSQPLAGISPLPFSESSPADTSARFEIDSVKAFVKEHPNSPLRFVPKDANELQMSYLETQAEVVLRDWQERRDILWKAHKEDLLAFSADPEVTQNDRDRQQALKALVLSLWPECGMKP